MYKQEFHQICRLKFRPFLLFQEFCSFKLHTVKHMEELAEEYITALSESCLYVYHCATIYLQFIYGQKCLDTHTSHLYAIVEHGHSYAAMTSSTLLGKREPGCRDLLPFGHMLVGSVTEVGEASTRTSVTGFPQGFCHKHYFLKYCVL